MFNVNYNYTLIYFNDGWWWRWWRWISYANHFFSFIRSFVCLFALRVYFVFFFHLDFTKEIFIHLFLRACVCVCANGDKSRNLFHLINSKKMQFFFLSWIFVANNCRWWWWWDFRLKNDFFFTWFSQEFLFHLGLNFLLLLLRLLCHHLRALEKMDEIENKIDNDIFELLIFQSSKFNLHLLLEWWINVDFFFALTKNYGDHHFVRKDFLWAHFIALLCPHKQQEKFPSWFRCCNPFFFLFNFEIFFLLHFDIACECVCVCARVCIGWRIRTLPK